MLRYLIMPILVIGAVTTTLTSTIRHAMATPAIHHQEKHPLS